MKLQVYNNTEEEVVRLKLKRVSGGIQLSCVDENGYHINDSNILRVDNNGKIYLMKKVSNKLGFETDCNGEIIVE